MSAINDILGGAAKPLIMAVMTEGSGGQRPMAGTTVAVAGWGYGAAWSFHMAVAGFDIGASAVHYSNSGAIAAPAAYRLEKLAVPIVAHYPERSSTSELADVKDLAQRLKARNENTEVHIYPGLDDRFDVESDSAYDPEGAALARRRTIEFLKRHLTAR